MPRVTDPDLLRELNSGAAPTLNARNTEAGIGQSQASAEKTKFDTKRGEALLPSEVRKAESDADRAEADARKAKRDAEKGMTLTEDERKAKLRGGNLDALVKQINRVQTLFNEGQAENAIPILGSLWEYLPTQENQKFDAAAAGLAEQGLAAFRVPGVGAQSDTELRQFVSANKPSTWNMDSRNLEQLRQLRSRVDSVRAELGLPAATWEGLPEEEGFDRDTSAAAKAAAKAVAGDTGATPPGADGGNAVPPAEPTGPQFSPGDPTMQAATGGTRRVGDPELQAGIDNLLRRGASYGDINAFAMRNGAEPINRQQYMAVRNFLRKNPNYTGSLVDVNKYEPISMFEKGVTSVGNSPVGSYLLGAGQMLSANTLDNMASDPERANLALAMGRAQNPVATGVGQVSGATLAALGGEAGLARLGMAPGILRGALSDVAMGAAGGAGAADGGNRAIGALEGAGYAARGSAGGNALGAGLKRLGTGVANPSVHAMAAEGIPLTVGQTYGKAGFPGRAIQGIEDRVEGLPVIGTMINSRRKGSMDAFNTQTFERALKPIDGSVGGLVGEEAVAAAQKLVDDAYTTALAGKVVQADKQFERDLTRSITKVAGLSRVGPEVLEDIKAAFEPFKDDAGITGEAMQMIKRDLERVKRNYRNDTRAHAVAGAIEDVKNAVFGMFERQAPEVVPAYRKADAAYRRLSTVEDAVLAGKNTEGKFTPAQLGTSDKSSTVKFEGKRAAASGKSPFHDFQRDAQNVLPNKIPDSGTAGRLGAGVPATMVGLTLAGILGAAYTKAGQRLLTKPGRGVQNEALKKALTAEETRLLLGKGGAGLGAVLGLETYPGQ